MADARKLIESALRGLGDGQNRVRANPGQVGAYRLLVGLDVMPDGAVIDALVTMAQRDDIEGATVLVEGAQALLDRCPDSRLDPAGEGAGNLWRRSYETELAMVRARELHRRGRYTEALEHLEMADPPSDDKRLCYRLLLRRSQVHRDQCQTGSLDVALMLATEAGELAQDLDDRSRSEALLCMGTCLEAMGADCDRVLAVNKAALEYASDLQQVLVASTNAAYALARDGQAEASSWLDAAEPLFRLLPRSDWRHAYRYWVRGLVSLAVALEPGDATAAANDLEVAAALLLRHHRRLELALVGIDLVRAYTVAGDLQDAQTLVTWLVPELREIGCPADILQVVRLLADAVHGQDTPITPELIASFHGMLRSR